MVLPGAMRALQALQRPIKGGGLKKSALTEAATRQVAGAWQP
ncbi:hypothetical protein SAMN05444920_108372 [Nonomuraea solani]|uniref:Uncharacterized protein n=1 Tax=Nonomuraea solani TaxID=1144553 RepID=A0A1H6E9E8_9ACTN|nr:hypothetical protein [Nonomuraea solani]SEG94380.1 hypothetical protein SAMN05444920_108372 [Nonomuraea solani]